MDYLKKNLVAGLGSEYEKELTKAFYDPKFTLEQNYYNDFQLNIYMVIYLAVDLIDTQKILKLIEDISDQSIIILWYRDIVLLRLVLGQIDFTQFKDRIRVVVAKEDDNLAIQKAIGMIGGDLAQIKDVFPIIVNTVDKQYITGTTTIIKKVREARTRLESGSSYAKDYFVGTYRNGFKNLPLLFNQIDTNDINRDNNSVFKGKPAVIVASGPSLDKNIDVLKQFENRAYILACDASLTTLRKHDIVPDFVGLIEWSYIVYEYFFKNKELNHNTRLITHFNATHEVVKEFKDSIVLFNSNSEGTNKYLSDITGRDVSSGWSGTSVAHYLLSAAKEIGFDPIILVGQDLSMSLDGRSHTSESEANFKIDIEDPDILWVKGNYADKVPTNAMWNNFLGFFEKFIYDNKMNVINATEGGAFIEGTKLMTLENALSAKSVINKVEVMTNLHQLVPLQSPHDISQIGLELKELVLKHMAFYERIQTAQKKIKNAKNRVLKGLKTDNQLDKVIDALKYVSDEIIGFILETPPFDFQYYSIVRQSNMYNQRLKVDSSVIEDIKANIKLYETILEFLDREVHQHIGIMSLHLEDIDITSNLGLNLMSDAKFKNYLDNRCEFEQLFSDLYYK